AREGAPPERRLAAAPARRGDERARPRRQPGVGRSVAPHLSRPPRDARPGRTVHALPGAPEDLGEEATRRALRASPPRRRRPRPAPRPPPPRGGGARDAPPLPRSDPGPLLARDPARGDRPRDGRERGLPRPDAPRSGVPRQASPPARTDRPPRP